MVFRIKFDQIEEKKYVKDSVKDYVLAQVNKTTRDQKIKAGRTASWISEDEEKKDSVDVHRWVQMMMETCHNLQRAGKLSNKAVEAYGWLASQWQYAESRALKEYAAIIEDDLRAAEVELRAVGSVLEEEVGPEVVIPPPELNPALNAFRQSHRPPAHLPGTQTT